MNKIILKKKEKKNTWEKQGTTKGLLWTIYMFLPDIEACE